MPTLDFILLVLVLIVPLSLAAYYIVRENRDLGQGVAGGRCQYCKEEIGPAQAPTILSGVNRGAGVCPRCGRW